jgi:hypothetical protein
VGRVVGHVGSAVAEIPYVAVKGLETVTHIGIRAVHACGGLPRAEGIGDRGEKCLYGMPEVNGQSNGSIAMFIATAQRHIIQVMG